VHRSQVAPGLLGEALDASLVGDVTGHGGGLGPPSPQLGGHLLDLAQGARRHHDAGSGLSEAAGDGGTDAAAASGHDRPAPDQGPRGHAAWPGPGAPTPASSRTAPSASTLARPSSAWASAGAPK